jgi:hypothetical protein
MKVLIISITLVCFLTIGFTQDRKEVSIKTDHLSNGPRMNQIELKKDYYKDMQRIVKDKKMISTNLQSGKLSVSPVMSKRDSKVKYQSTADPKPKQNLKSDSYVNFGQNKEQYFSRVKSGHKLNRVKGHAPREKVVKIENHTQYAQEILIEALGNTRPIEASQPKLKIKK